MKFSRTSALALLAWMLVSGCKDKNAVQVYRVSKGDQEPPASQASMPENAGMGGLPPMEAPGGAGGTAGQPQITQTPPPGWTAQPLSTMRQASYLVKGGNGATADISLVTLAGSAGGVLDNVNRWLSQLGQPAITAEQLAQMARHVQSPLGDVTVVDLEGLPPGADATKDGRIVAGIASGDSKTYFFKLRGNAALAESQKEAFIQWIGTVRVAAETAAEPTAPAASGAGSEKPQIKWEAPEEWKAGAPSAMRCASFSVTGQNGESADISVSVFGGDGGGDLANVNRWRTQIGLGELGADELKPLIVPVNAKDGQILTVDMTGPKARILAGWASVDGKSWFFKLTAPDQLAGSEKAAFAKFLESVQFHP